MKNDKKSKAYYVGYWLGMSFVSFIIAMIIVFLLALFGLVNFTHRQISVSVVEANEQPITSSISKVDDIPAVESPAVEPEPIDYFEVLVSAMFRYETGNGNSPLWTEFNNAGGIICFTSADRCTRDGFQIYDSQEHGMSSLRYHMELYVAKYGYDLRAIRSEYCYECGETDVVEFTKIYQEEIEKWTQ